MYRLRNIVIYRLIFIYIMMDFVCLLNAIAEGKDISSEEITRRKKVAEQYFSSLAEEQEDWIETYHLNLPNTDFPAKNIKRKIPLSQDLPDAEVRTSDSVFHSEILTDFHEDKNSKTSPPIALQPDFSRSNGKLSREDFEERREIVLDFYPKAFDLETDSYVGSPKSGASKIKEKSVKNNPVGEDVPQNKIVDSSHQKASISENGDSFSVSKDKNDYLPSSEEILTPESNVVAQNNSKIEELNQNLNTSENDHLNNFITSNSEKKITDHKSSSSALDKDEMNAQSLNSGTDAAGSDKIVTLDEQVKTQNIPNKASEYSRGKSEEPVEKKGVSMKSSGTENHCSEADSKNNICDDILNARASNSKLKSSLDDEKPVAQEKESLNTMDSERNVKIPPLKNKNLKRNSVSSNLGKRQGNMLKHEVDIISKNSDNDQNDNFLSVKSADLKDNEVSEYSSNPLHHRQKLASRYFSTLIQEQKDWIESYHSTYAAGNFEQSDPSLLERIIKNEKAFKQLQTQERMYLTRWIHKLQNKFVGHSLDEHTTLSFSFTADLVNDLEQLSSSENFDIIWVDEVIGRIISNATVHSGLYLSNFNIASCMPFIYAVAGISLFFFFLHYRYSKSLLVILGFTAAFLWHGFKMYQQKIAQKHALMSSVESSYCVSILSQESGVLAHLKEYFRHWIHNEDCKKYYEALMIDPIVELSFSIVLADMVSSTFMQTFNPLGVTMNTFYKDLTYKLSFSQSIQILILLIVVFGCFVMFLAMALKYKINLPFYMGSVEPTPNSGGSRVEDVVLDRGRSYLKDTTEKSGISLNGCTIQTVCISKETNTSAFIEDVKEKCLTLQSSKSPRRRLSL